MLLYNTLKVINQVITYPPGGFVNENLPTLQIRIKIQ
jgi:hypothetical protein